MSGGVVALLGVAMLFGLVGTIVPGLPGLAVIWLAGLVWALLEDGSGRWVVLALLTALFAAGTAAGFVVPARTMGAEVPRSTLLLGAAGAVVGMFVIPVVGFPVGGVVAVYAAELRRTRDRQAAWRSTRLALRGVGLGMAVEVATGVLMVGIWVAGVVLT